MCASKPHLLLVDSSSTNVPLGARFRRRRPGPELELVETFLREMPLRIPRDCRATVFREPRLESGYPDLIIVVWREQVTLKWRPERESLETLDLRLMHFMHHAQRASENELVRWFGRRATSSIERLYDAAMIRKIGSSWTPCALRHSFAASEIIAIEAKISKWTEVLNQALLNTWFASKSYVLVPNPPSNRQLDAAQRLGIGVCSLDGGEVREVVSDATRLPRSYASWVLNDWAWRSSLQGIKGQTA
ncbi:MAG: hypothetical protein ACLQMS_03880 [Desulfomonilaceae bacterium]